MKLYVMRHGPAEDGAPSGLDGDRALSEGGRRRVRQVAKALLDAEEVPLHVISSPLVRAVQTAEIVALLTSNGHPSTVEIRRDLSPGGNAVALTQACLAEGRRRVMLVGHEPDLSGLVSALLGTFNRSFDKAMVVGVQLRPSGSPHARLRFVLDPKTLRLDPDARGAT